MKIKELMKEMERTNKFLCMVGENQYIISISINGYDTNKFHTFKEFEKYLKQEYAKWFIPQLLEQEIELDGHGCSDCFFDYQEPNWFGDGGKIGQGSIQLAIWME